MALFDISPKYVKYTKAVISEIEKISSEAKVNNAKFQPLFTYAWQLEDHKFAVTNGWQLVITKSKDGLTFKEDATTDEKEKTICRIVSMMDLEYNNSILLPDIDKFKQFIKDCKERKLAKPIYNTEAGISVNANFIVRGMKLTGSNKLYYVEEKSKKALKMCGKDIEYYMMPILTNPYDTKPTEL